MRCRNVGNERSRDGHRIRDGTFVLFESLAGDKERGLLSGQRAPERRLQESGRDVRYRIRERVPRREE